MSSKSKARLPAEPLISMRIAFLRPLANRVASKTPRAPPRNSARKTAASSTVTGPRPLPAVPVRPACSAGNGRSSTKVRSRPETRPIASPMMNCVRSTMCAPMSPSAPDPALALSSRHDSGASGSTIQSWRYCARTWCTVPMPALRDQLPGQPDRRDAPVGEADHRPDAGGGGLLGGARSSPRPPRRCWPAASRTGRACPPRGPRWRSRRGCRRACRRRPGRCRRASTSACHDVSVVVPAQPSAACGQRGRRPGRPARSSAGGAGGRRTEGRCARPASGRRP